jgi:hypothetical protein
MMTATAFADEQDDGNADRKPPELTTSTRDPKYDGQAVSVTFTTAGSGGIAQLLAPGQVPSFIILANPEKKSQIFDVWVSGDLADVMDRFDMGLFSMNLKKGLVIQATGKLSQSPPEDGDDMFFRLYVDD